MSVNAAQLHIRSASSAGDDGQFIVAAWDSTLPYLASVGAGEMWGDQPFSEREGFEQDIMDIIRKSEENEGSDSRRLLVAELQIPVDGTYNVVKVGAAMIQESLPYYLTERHELKSEIEKANLLLFIEVLISDHRTQPRHKGTGIALIEAIKRRALAKGKDALYVDAWAGNERKLNKYYENIGFTQVADFSLQRRNGSTWLGTLYRMNLVTSA